MDRVRRRRRAVRLAAAAVIGQLTVFDALDTDDDEEAPPAAAPPAADLAQALRDARLFLAHHDTCVRLGWRRADPDFLLGLADPVAPSAGMVVALKASTLRALLDHIAARTP